MEPPLQSGEMVVELGGVFIKGGIISGAVTGALITWAIKKNWLPATSAFFVGAIISGLLGYFLANLIYRRNGNTVVVRVGVGALSKTIQAGLSGGIISGLFIAALGMVLLDANKQSASMGMGCGLALALIFSVLSPLM